MDEGPGLGQFTGLEELAHLLGEDGDGVGAVEELTPFREQPSGLLSGDLQLLLAIPVLPDALRGVGHLDVGGLDDLPDAAQPLLHVLKLLLDGLKPLTLLGGHPVHLLVQQLHQVSDVGLGEDVGPNLIDDELLEALGVEPGGLAGAAAPLEEGVADVVGVLAALGLGCGHGLAAGLAPEQAAEQIGAGGAPGVDFLGGPGPQQLPGPLELPLADDGGVCVLDAHGRNAVLGGGPPDQSARVGFVEQHVVDSGLEPLLSPGAVHALGVEGLGHVEDAAALEHHVEDAAGHGVGWRVKLQLRALLRPVLDVNLPVAVGGVGGDPEAARCGLPHPPRDLLGKIFAVKFVHALDDGLKKSAGCGVIGLLGDGHDPDASAPQHGLEGDGVLALSGEPRKLPDENLLERSLGLAGLVEHPLELRPVCNAPALGLVHVLAGDQGSRSSQRSP